MALIEVRDLDGQHIGFVSPCADDVCGACGNLLTSHGMLGWVAAENGHHAACNLSTSG